jgi:hypothetical protein
MVSAARVLGLAAAGAILLMAGVSADPASAQGEITCKSDVITVTGPRKGGFKRWTLEQERRGEGAAMTGAVAAWERKVGDVFGGSWKLWTQAKDKSRDCEGGKGLLNSVACTVSGRPCALKSALAEDDDKGKGGGRPKSYSRDDDDNDAGWSRGYQREMERQERLKIQRDRAESRALEREEARQRYLAQRRDRREGQRQRYYDDD